MVKEQFLFIFVLPILQEMSMSLLGVFVQYFFHLQNLKVKFLLILNQTHVDKKPKFAEWCFFVMYKS